jgi:hypothetical protein
MGRYSAVEEVAAVSNRLDEADVALGEMTVASRRVDDEKAMKMHRRM